MNLIVCGYITLFILNKHPPTLRSTAAFENLFQKSSDTILGHFLIIAILNTEQFVGAHFYGCLLLHDGCLFILRR